MGRPEGARGDGGTGKWKMRETGGMRMGRYERI